ncbi:MAG: S1 RNA-binding domain-containing protein [Candidatus Margulisiibacteriota bacterium]
MAEEYKATSIDKTKGSAEFSEVEELIRQTLAESKKLEKPAQAATPLTTPVPVTAEPRKEEFRATTFTPPKPAQPVAAPVAPKPVASGPAKEVPQASGYEATFKEYKIGDIVKGKVLKVDPSGILVDINYKADGLILPEEITDRASDEHLKVGEIINVLIENLENKEGYVVLSKRKADFEVKWKIAQDAFRDHTVLSGQVIQVLRGGLVVDCDGLRGFVPASQVSLPAGATLESLADQTIPVKVIEVNSRQGKIVLSHKQAAGQKGQVDTNKLFNELEVGQVRHGKVVNLKTFGAFVDLGGVEGLIHLTELSWKRVKHPSEVVKTGQELDVFVLGVDKISKKVSLGLKELQPDPWANATQLYKPGQIVKAKILRFAKFGAFAELEQGLEGLIHISEMSKEPVEKPEDAGKIGDVVDVKILRVLPDEQRIGLSMKAVRVAEEREANKAAANPPVEEKKITIGDMIADKERAKAERDAEFEVEVELPPAAQ